MDSITRMAAEDGAKSTILSAYANAPTICNKQMTYEAAEARTLQPTQNVIEIDTKQNRADNTALFNTILNWEVARKKYRSTRPEHVAQNTYSIKRV
jgi:hypothetical protein